MEDEVLAKDEMLARALSTPADYSNNFVQVVEELCAKLSQALGIAFKHNGDMNYSSGQTIELWLDKSYEPVSKRKDAFFWIVIFVSSRGKFFAIRERTRNALNHWISIPAGERDQKIESYVQKSEQFLEAEGYISLPQSVLSQRAVGHFTRLDNLPATVFNVLFTELI